MTGDADRAEPTLGYGQGYRNQAWPAHLEALLDDAAMHTFRRLVETLDDTRKRRCCTARGGVLGNAVMRRKHARMESRCRMGHLPRIEEGANRILSGKSRRPVR